MTTATIALPEIEDGSEVEKAKLYHLIMLNDDDHTFEYVIEMLQNVLGFSERTAGAHTLEADATGSTILLTCGFAEAERKRDLIHAYGPDWRMPRSMGSVTALVEPACQP